MEAVARARNLRVSHKDLVELGRFIKGDTADEAKAKLERVTEKEQAVPYTQHNRDLAHKENMAAGRYPVKAAEELKGVVHAAQANAEHQGGDPDTVKISTVITNKGANRMKPDRQRGRTMKLSHVTVKVTATDTGEIPGPEPATEEEEPETSEEATEAEDEEDEAETTAPAPDPAEIVSGTVDDAKNALEDFDGDLDDVLQAEENGKNRSTLIEHINELRDEHAEHIAEEEHDYTELVDNTISDAKELLNDVENPDYDAALQAEKNGENRSTFIDWLEAQQGSDDQ